VGPLQLSYAPLAQTSSYATGRNQLIFAREGQNDCNLLFYLTNIKSSWRFNNVFQKLREGQLPGCSSPLVAGLVMETVFHWHYVVENSSVASPKIGGDKDIFGVPKCFILWE